MSRIFVLENGQRLAILYLCTDYTKWKIQMANAMRIRQFGWFGESKNENVPSVLLSTTFSDPCNPNQLTHSWKNAYAIARRHSTTHSTVDSRHSLPKQTHNGPHFCFPSPFLSFSFTTFVTNAGALKRCSQWRAAGTAARPLRPKYPSRRGKKSKNTRSSLQRRILVAIA